MPDFGLQVYNQSNVLQIDSTYKNLALRAKGSVAATTATAQGDWFYATVTVSAGVSPVMAFRCPVACYLRQTTIANGNITYLFLVKGNSQIVQYWIFDDPVQATRSGNYGLQVFNSAGSLVFDSRSKYMRVLDSVRGNGNLSDPIEAGFTRSYSGLPAVVQGQLRFRVTNNATGQPPAITVFGALEQVAPTFSGTNITFAMMPSAVVQYSVNQNVPPGQFHTAYDYLVLDVANI
ncbi:hypothetical protein [Caballeronia sp. LZ001]|uniref:hypothetical protein n=1 Tax=Caballeronia sp. LZ001 TaxID=3038553 RepID=UPI0028676B59|nr:hypothetical protein [Caballeronia sp. LZ001]MDR5801213.1 hypothetical protein [Caballeronia sp. LZ001]